MKSRPKSKSGLWRLISGSTQPLYALNPRRQIVYCNRAMGEWLGCEERQLVGLVCHYHSRPDAAVWDRLAAALCPPPEAFQGQFRSIVLQPPAPVDVGQLGPDGKALPAVSPPPPRPALCAPLSDDEGNPGVLVVVGHAAAGTPSDGDTFSPRHFPPPASLHQQLRELRRRSANIHRLDRLIGTSDSMRHVRRQVAAAIASGASATIVGPANNALEQIARTIHYSQYPPGKAPPLIPIDCALCDAENLQAALRHLHSERLGATAGRLLLTRVERLAEPAMRELAEFVRLPTFDIGLLTTTNVSPGQLAQQGTLDAYLARYLATLEIVLPPLRERLEDLPLAAQAIVEDFNAEGNQQLSGLSPDALEMLYRYPWPGDLDELVHVVYEACQHARSSTVSSLDLPASISQAVDVHEQRRPQPKPIDLSAYLQQVENELIRRALLAAKGNKTQAARLLGISRQRMIRWAELHGNSGAEE